LIVLANGKNLYPDEIESYYLNRSSSKKFCVWRCRGPGDPKKEQLHAVIVPNFEALKEKEDREREGSDSLDVEGISHELPKREAHLELRHLAGELPRTTTRKIKRFEVEKRVKEQRPGRRG